MHLASPSQGVFEGSERPSLALGDWIQRVVQRGPFQVFRVQSQVTYCLERVERRAQDKEEELSYHLLNAKCFLPHKLRHPNKYSLQESEVDIYK